MRGDTVGNSKYFLRKGNGDVYLEDIIASAAFELGTRVESRIGDGITSDELTNAINALCEARKLGI